MLSLVLFTIITPFLTYYVSTTLFYQKANSRAPGKRPPIVPFFLPVLHTFSLAYEGPQRYFATVIKQYGSFAPFSVRAGLKSFVVLRDPDHVLKVLSAPAQMTRTAARMEVSKKLFGASKELLSRYAKGNNKKQDLIKYANSDLPQKHLTDTPLASLTDTFISILSSNLNDKMFQVGSWTQIEDFWSFFQHVVTRCIIETLCGSAILKQYSSIVKDYHKFAEAADGFVPGMPRFVVSTGYESQRERLLQGIEKWLKTNHSGAEFAKIGGNDPVWNEHTGSKYIQERDDVFAKIEGVDLRHRAAEMLCVIHEANASILSPALWTIFETLYRPRTHDHLLSQISRYYSPHSGKYDINNITSNPLLRGVQDEARRLRVANVLTRCNDIKDFPLDSQWKLAKGDTVLIFSHDLALNTNLWAKTRPRGTVRPLEDFWAERLIPDREASSTKRDATGTGRASSESLDVLGGALKDDVLGRDYAQAMQTAIVAVFLMQFDLQLCDPEAFAAAIPAVRELAYGTVKPMEWVTVRIRKRRGDKNLVDECRKGNSITRR